MSLAAALLLSVSKGSAGLAVEVLLSTGSRSDSSVLESPVHAYLVQVSPISGMMLLTTSSGPVLALSGPDSPIPTSSHSTLASSNTAIPLRCRQK
jgi:hypothetical protein